MKDLVEIINYVKPTALLGLSTIKGAFNQGVVEAMSALNPRPIIFPLSNPVRLSECEFSEAVEWSGGRVIFASGSPFPEQSFGRRTLYPGQGNNMYVFPGTCPEQLGGGLVSQQLRRHRPRCHPVEGAVCHG